MKDEALKLALEALEKSIAITMANIDLRNKAITAIKQALAAQPAPVQEPVWWPSPEDQPIDNGPDYEDGPDEEGFSGPRPWNGFAQPAPVMTDEKGRPVAFWGGKSIEPIAQPAPVQEPVLHEIEQYRMQMAGISTAALGYWKEGDSIHPDYDTPALRDVAKLYAKYAALHAAAQPAVPDAIHHTDLSEHPQYIEGWNDCRAEMLKGMKP